MTNVAVNIPKVDSSVSSSNKGRKKESNQSNSRKLQFDGKNNDFTKVFGLDEFEQFSARASSGGSLYGVLRKQVLNEQNSENFENTLSKNNEDLTTTEHQPMQKNCPISENNSNKNGNFLCPPDPFYSKHRPYRSKSLVQSKQSLVNDKNILKFLHDYAAGRETGQLQPKLMAAELRRHSEAALNYQMLLKNRLFNANHDELTGRQIDLSGFEQILSSLNTNEEDQSNIRRETRQNSIIVPAISISRDNTPIPKDESNSKNATNYNSSYSHCNMDLLQPTSLSVCRRRSFSIKDDEIFNEGDEVLVVPVLKVHNTSIPLTQFVLNNDRERPTRAPKTGISRRHSAKSWRVSSLKNYKKSLTSSINPQPLSLASPPSNRRSSSQSPDVYDTNECVPGKGIEEMGPPLYRVLVLGGPGVGKTALTQQFLTSEHMAAQNTSFDDCLQVTVPILLDGVDIFVEFIDLPYSGDAYHWRDYKNIDGYIVIYSIIDRRSFNKAVDIIDQIRNNSVSSDHPIVLVANKNDLERSRLIGKQEGKATADLHKGNYVEVSAILNHKVDNIIVEVLKQIRRRRIAVMKKRNSQLCGADVNAIAKRYSLVKRMSHCFSGVRAGQVDDKVKTQQKNAEATEGSKENLWAKIIRNKTWKRILSRSCENLL